MPGLVLPQLKCCGNCDGTPLADSREDVREHIARLSRILFVIPEPEVTPSAGGGPEPVIPAVAERPEKAAANYGHLLARCVLPRPGQGMAGGSHRCHAHRDPGPGKCCSRRHRPGGYRAVTALSLTLSTLPTLTRHRSGNKLMRRQGRAQRSQPTEGGREGGREKPCPPQHLARDRETARPPGTRGAAGPPGRRGSTVQAAAATWRTRS
jgi:hypothetical protein